MAVFTELSDEDRNAITAAYGIEALSSVIGIADGDTETTYLFRSASGEFIVTLFENGAAPLDLEQAFATMETLHASGVPCPLPRRTIGGKATFSAAGRLVAIVGFVPGSSSANANAAKCGNLGAVMAQIHMTLERKPKRVSCELPRGSVHGALVHDNVFFVGSALSGLINFRLRHDDVLISEVADVLVGWTLHANGELDHERATALLQGYDSVRRLTAAEKQALPAFVLASVARHYAGQKDADLIPALGLQAYRSAMTCVTL